MSTGRLSSVFPAVVMALIVALALVLPSGVSARTYGIRSLTNTNCVHRDDVQSSGGLGDDRNPLVLGATALIYSGDAKVGTFNLTDLSITSSHSRRVDGLFSDLSNGTLWTFGFSATTWFTFSLSDDNDPQNDITHLIPLALNASGVLVLDASRSAVELSQPLNPTYSQPGVFQGMGEFIFTSRVEAPSDRAGVFHVDIGTGQVTRMNNPADGERWTTVPEMTNSENFIRWGVMERRGDTLHIVGGVEEGDDGKGIFRFNLDGTLNSKIYEGDLSDAAGIAVSYSSLLTGATPRWYIHAEGSPDNADFAGSDEWNEWVMACDAVLDSSASSVPCALCSLWAMIFA